MAYYTNIDLSEANIILHLYDLPMIKKLIPIGHGISNSNYIAQLADNSEVILKISNDKDFDQLLSEQHILLNLKQLGFSYSPSPILTKTLSPVYAAEPWHGVIFPRITGQVPPITTETCKKIGSALAELHLVSSEQKLKGLIYPIRNALEVSYFPSDIKEFTQQKDCPEDFKQIINSRLTDEALAFYLSLEQQLPHSILHGDLYFDNTLFHQNELVGMLDFEQAGFGPCLFDIGVSLSGTCLKDQKLDEQLVKSFLTGYISQRRLTQTEIELIGQQVLCGFYSIALWRIHRFFLGNLSIERKLSYQQLLQMAEDTAIRFPQTWFDKTIKAIQ